MTGLLDNRGEDAAPQGTCCCGGLPPVRWGGGSTAHFRTASGAPARHTDANGPFGMIFLASMKTESLRRLSAATSGLPRMLLAGSIFLALFATAACSSSPAAVPATARILIEFKNPVDGAASDLLSRLEGVSDAAIRYVTSVSPTRHAYALACPEDDASCDAALRALRKDSAVLNVSPDLLRNPLQARP